jgi:hypothetical protein
MTTFPKSVNAINQSLSRIDSLDVGRKLKIMANIIVAQMLPQSALRGGTSLKIRFGDFSTRGSKDLDVARSMARERFLKEFQDNLSIGWHGFKGELLESKKISRPVGVPIDYITETWRVKLYFNGNPWLNQEVDLGHDEIGDSADFDLESSDEINAWFEACGLPIPSAMRVIKPHHQIAQKIHALTSNPSERIHDLVDLQVILRSENIDLTLTALTSLKLFNFRRAHTWPPILDYHEELEMLYSYAVENTGAIEEFSEAVNWFNRLIDRLQKLA